MAISNPVKPMANPPQGRPAQRVKSPCSCKQAFSKREKSLIGVLICLILVGVAYWSIANFTDYNRFELVQAFGNFEEPIMYKLDKKTGTVTVINQLWEFDTERFKDSDPTAKHWAFPNRMANSSDLLFREDLKN